MRGRERGGRGTAGRGRSLHTVTGANLTPLGTGETTDGKEMEEDDERECEVTAVGSQASRRGRGRPPGARTGPSKCKGGEADLGRESEPPAKY